MSPSTSTTTFFTLGLLVLLILGVQASPLQQQQSASDENNNGAGAAVDSIVLSRGSVGQAAAASNPFLEKALQRASFRLSQLPSSSSSNGNSDSGDFFSSLRDRVYLIRPFARNPFTRKRSCFINAGMGNNCDFKDLISAASARRIWQSPNSPGKKRSVLPALSSSSSSSSDESSPSSSSAELLRNYLAAVAANEPALNSPSSSSSYSSSVQKRMQCISGLPGGDCENSFLGGESLGQDFLRPGGRNPGRR